MQIKLFTIPINNIEEHNKELNVFLSNNKIIEIEKHLMQTNNGVFWCIYINYVSKAATSPYIKTDGKNKNKKVDYKAILTAEEFKNFEKLRIIRTSLSKQDAVSAFVVATDNELSEMAKLPEITLSELKKIKGFGDKKAEKYGQRIIQKL